MSKVSYLLFKFSTLVLISAGALGGCSTAQKTRTMMPAPVVFHQSAVDPFAHLSEAQKSTKIKVFYATNRVPKATPDEQKYGNAIDTQIHLGEAIVQLGRPDMDWDDLYKYSISDKQILDMPIALEKTIEMATMPVSLASRKEQLSPELQSFVDLINKEISTAIDKEIMVYVHGTKVDFANSAIMTAEIDHFTGRDYVGVAFAWPSHQNILAYLMGTDVKRARDSSEALQRLLILLADYTDAEHINILSYSAGGKVTSRALFELSQSYAELETEQLKEKLRLGAVVFAAADVAIDRFLQRMHVFSQLANQIVITVTDDDNALNAGKKFMGGAVRAGSEEAEIIEEEFIVREHLSNVEIIDVSFGKEVRGFNITGHHYWYRHPWMSSDIIFLMRTDLPAARRGLSPGELEGVWYLAPDYPEKIRGAARTELEGQW